MSRTPLQCLSASAPEMRSFRVEEVGADYAVLMWNVDASASLYEYEVSYAPRDEPNKHRARFPSTRSAAVLRSLKSHSNYSASIITVNECAQSQALSLLFTTKHTAIHHAITHVMPHEILLTVAVLAIWMFILRHFFVTYTRVTFVSPLTHLDYKVGTKKSCARRTPSESSETEFSRSVSQCRLHSIAGEVRSAKASRQFSLLENAVHAWRSETVLSKGAGFRDADRGLNRQGPGMESDPQSAVSNAASSPFASPRAHKRCSLTQLPLSASATRITVEDSDALTPSRPGAVVLTHESPGILRFQHADAQMPSTSGTTTAFMIPSQVAGPPASPPTERVFRKNGCLTQPPSTRKVSEVLLGKATNDIRRCSSGEFLRPLRRKSKASSIGGWSSLRIRRRSSMLLASLKLRNSRKRNKKNMEMLAEEGVDDTDSCEALEYKMAELLRVPILSATRPQENVEVGNQDASRVVSEVSIHVEDETSTM